jgi:acetylornithine deacetylase/succinyl-diaminopimelate desuccinylase-like protein
VVGEVEHIEIELSRSNLATESGYETPLFEIISQVVDELEPGSLVTPFMVTGGTDGRYLARQRVQVYGFWPLKTSAEDPGLLGLAHAHNERISLENLDLGVRALWEIVRRLCVGGGEG